MRGTQPLTLITQNTGMRAVLKNIDKIAASDTSILLVGETGVGKEIFADYIHRMSSRSQNPIIKIGLSALPADLMASELFGHEKGAFTSAESTKKGLFELADTGSIFLDDIDDVPLEIQTKLLRVLESRELMHIGGSKTIPVDIRLISASKVDLNELVKRHMFRADLFYRINVASIEIPPLRQRIDDIPLLAQHFMQKYAPNRKLTISSEAMSFLKNYCWPGNVRELRNVIQRAALFAEHEITLEEIPTEIKSLNSTDHLVRSCSVCFAEKGLEFNQVMDCLEYKLLNEALKRTDGNQSNAAKLLNLSLSTFRDKWKKYQIFPADCQHVN